MERIEMSQEERTSCEPRQLAWPGEPVGRNNSILEFMQPFPPPCSDRRTVRCLEETSNRGRKRSSADFTFCCIAIDHFKRTPEETAAKLLEVSSKARENGEAYALDQP